MMFTLANISLTQTSLIQASGAHWYTDSKLWVLIPLLLFFALIIKKGAHTAIGEALDERAEKIKTELDEAKRLREEAQALLASYQRKQKEAEAQAENIIKQARSDAENMAAQARQDLSERLERRAAQAEAKIATAETKAMADVKARAADMALATAEKLLRSEVSAAKHAELVKTGVKQIGKSFN
ncbi:MAG: F0F1 ATP synthase subunit B [Litorimonas sp.]